MNLLTYLLLSLVCTVVLSFHHVGGLKSGLARSRGNQRQTLQMLDFMTHYEEISVSTDHGMSIFDITPQVEAIVQQSGVQEGTVTVLSKHSTVSVTINEMEGRLVDDIRQFFLNLAPADKPYLHNDLDYRVGPEDWPGGDGKSKV